MGIASVISFCTHDYRFLKHCIQGVAPFSQQILIPVCDHFYDGRVENLALLETIYSTYPECTFIEFAFDPNRLYGTDIKRDPNHPDWARHWHNTARLVAFYFLDESVTHLLFCDVDEIAEAEKFKEWLEKFAWKNYEALRFSTYWYFRESRFQATVWPDGPLLIKKEVLTPEILLDEDERMGMFAHVQEKKQRLVLGMDEKPMVHHFSWVRSKEEMLAKVSSWGHHWERNWQQLIEEEYSREFKGNDFVRRYDYITVDPVIDPMKEEVPPSAYHQKKTFSNVIRVTAKDIFRKELKRNLA